MVELLRSCILYECIFRIGMKFYRENWNHWLYFDDLKVLLYYFMNVILCTCMYVYALIRNITIEFTLNIFHFTLSYFNLLLFLCSTFCFVFKCDLLIVNITFIFALFQPFAFMFTFKCHEYEFSTAALSFKFN